jgi:hypothetical protein
MPGGGRGQREGRPLGFFQITRLALGPLLGALADSGARLTRRLTTEGRLFMASRRCSVCFSCLARRPGRGTAAALFPWKDRPLVQQQGGRSGGKVKRSWYNVGTIGRRCTNVATGEEIARLGVGLVPQGRRLSPTLTVAENLALGRLRRQGGRGLRWELDRIFEFGAVAVSGAGALHSKVLWRA